MGLIGVLLGLALLLGLSYGGWSVLLLIPAAALIAARLIAEIGIERGDFALLIRPWIIIDDGGDDNPDITDYYGYGDITAVYKWRGQSFTLMGRGNLDTGKGAARFSWSSPPFLGPLRGYVTAFTGYGETMIDYDWNQSVLGVGLTLNDLLDRPGERR